MKISSFNMPAPTSADLVALGITFIGLFGIIWIGMIVTLVSAYNLLYAADALYTEIRNLHLHSFNSTFMDHVYAALKWAADDYVFHIIWLSVAIMVAMLAYPILFDGRRNRPLTEQERQQGLLAPLDAYDAELRAASPRRSKRISARKRHVQ